MAPRFEIRDTPLAGLKLIERLPILDGRGFLERLFSKDELRNELEDKTIAQVNRTLTSSRGTVRGLHFQFPPHSEIKFVSCLRGEAFDVAVDLRQRSPTFMGWHGEVLRGSEHVTILIPEGFAHGFQALTDDCELLYFHTAAYEPASEGGINARDPILAIRWPEEITELSERDAAYPMLTSAYRGLDL
jgi:dTDP-4-dehydrorhamnose 3,5-epimerase